MAVSDSRPTILVIDDEPPVRQLTRRALEPEFSLLEAADGGTAPLPLQVAPTAASGCHDWQQPGLR